MARGEAIVHITNTNSYAGSHQNCIVKANSGSLYKFFASGENSDLYWSRSPDKGITWTQPTAFDATITVNNIAVWYDRWTPGITTDVIHVAWVDDASDDVFYRSLDVASAGSETAGSEITVFAGASAVPGASTCLAITKARGGNLFCMFDIDGGTEVGFYRSTDAGATWGTADGSGAMTEAAADYFQLYPGNYADNQDIDCLYLDRSADELSLKVFDDSANAMGSETTISGAGGLVEPASTTVVPMFCGAVRHSDGHLLVLFWNASDTANADLKCYDVNGSGSITAKTDVVLNSTDDQGGCAIAYDSGSSTIYAFYIGKSDGSETAYTAVNVYYKTSTDGGATWGSETLLSTLTRAYRALSASPNIANTEFALDSYVLSPGGGGTCLCHALLPSGSGGITRARLPGGLSGMG